MAERRLALCSLMLGGDGARFHPSSYASALRAYVEFRRFDYQVTHSSLADHRAAVSARRPAASPTRALT
jgi:hypothetical protein